MCTVVTDRRPVVRQGLSPTARTRAEHVFPGRATRIAAVVPGATPTPCAQPANPANLDRSEPVG